MSNPGFYPEPITSLPQIEVPFDNVVGYLLQGVDSQSVFFELGKGSHVPPHSHEAQWGVLLDGELELSIGQEKHVFQKGASYFIPEGTVHEGRALTDCKILDVFFTPARYQAKK
ncbi:MAG: cupin domain-containing protein [Deltaproteobacteria bacterium]|nr:cupin domain-containing protein [Deltaproteobacteria bacterium]